MADEQQAPNGGAPAPEVAPLSAEAVKAQERAAAEAAKQPWYATLEDEEARGVAALHKWATPGDAVKSYRELEKLRGVPADRLLTIPDKSSTDDPEAWGKFYDRLGRPAKPEDYQLPVPADFGDPEFAKTAATKFHSLGFSKAQAGDLATWWNEQQQGFIAASDRQREQESQVDLQNLQREWGGAYREREELAQRAVRTFVQPLGMGEDELNLMEEAIGTANLIKLFANIGEKLGESRPVEGNALTMGGQSFGLTPDSARARYDQLKMDREWVAKALNTGSAENQEWDRLQRIMSSGGR